MDIQPFKIKEDIQSRPLLQRKVAAEGYKRNKVESDWELELFHIRDSFDNKKNWVVTGAPKGEMYPDIEFEVSKIKYPEFNRLLDRSVFWVNGTISNVSETGLHIKLENPVVKFTKSEKESHPITISSPTFIDSQLHFGKGNNVKTEQNFSHKQSKKEWYEKPLGIILIALIIACISYLLGWN